MWPIKPEINLTQETQTPDGRTEPASSDPRIDALSEVFGEAFGRTFRDPVLFMNETLGAPPPLAMYRRDFRLLSRALYLESVYRRREGFNPELLDNFARMTGEKIINITTLFGKLTARMELLFKNAGIEITPVYLQKQNLYIPVIAPHARNFVALLRKLDDFYNMVGCAHLNGLIDGGQRRTAELDSRKAVRAFIGMVRTEQARLRKESLRLRETRAGVPESSEVAMAENLADEAHATYDAAAHADDHAANVSPDEAASVLEGIVASGVAASSRAKPKKDEPAIETQITSTAAV